MLREYISLACEMLTAQENKFTAVPRLSHHLHPEANLHIHKHTFKTHTYTPTHTNNQTNTPLCLLQSQDDWLQEGGNEPWKSYRMAATINNSVCVYNVLGLPNRSTKRAHRCYRLHEKKEKKLNNFEKIYSQLWTLTGHKQKALDTLPATSSSNSQDNEEWHVNRNDSRCRTKPSKEIRKQLWLKINMATLFSNAAAYPLHFQHEGHIIPHNYTNPFYDTTEAQHRIKVKRWKQQ